MEAKHTKGPWDCSGSHVVARRTGVQLASVLPPNAYDPKNVVEQANARLIAAAPELLEALNGLFTHCAMVHTRWGDGCNQREADAAIASARAAIAKATGQSR